MHRALPGGADGSAARDTSETGVLARAAEPSRPERADPAATSDSATAAASATLAARRSLPRMPPARA
ncbi:hypothetical protein FHR32_007547 [Streptosporangium album]|uniref:Uncharacterized protein n=1 Tax=Streptosporangium album TaxID=47479 RepID=A0A7W7S440_9ACTN|nr:hypothetical protein [Streptosporangium album]MBB4943147.1 hypothetical protein [Streptosporangium album]